MSRLSNYELARVVAMLMIVYFHFSINTRWGINEHPKDEEDKELPYIMTRRHYLIFVGESIGKTGVQLFMIMSGYFLGSRPASMSTILRTWFRVISWCWLIPFAFHILADRKMETVDWMQAIFPVITCHFWFVSTYLFTMIISPMLAKVVQVLTVREFAGVLATMIFGQSFTLYWKYSHRLKEYCYSPWLWFIFLYLVGAFIKQHPDHVPKWKTWKWATVFSIFFAIDLITVYKFRSNPNIQWVKDNYGPMTLVRSDNSLLSFFMAVSVFMLCGSINFESRIVNWLAKMTFSVYLIHDHYMMRPYIFTKWIKAEHFLNTPYFYLVFFSFPLGIFLVCTVIEAVRQKLFSRVETHVCNVLKEFIAVVSHGVTHLLGLDPTKEERLMNSPNLV